MSSMWGAKTSICLQRWLRKEQTAAGEGVGRKELHREAECLATRTPSPRVGISKRQHRGTGRWERGIS